MNDSNNNTVHDEDVLVRKLFEAKIKLVEQRLEDFMISSQKADEIFAKELERRLHESNDAKRIADERERHFISRGEAFAWMTIVASIISIVAGLIGRHT